MDSGISFSKHAEERPVNRGITQAQVLETIRASDHVVEETVCMHVYQKIFKEENKMKMLRVFVNICKDPVLIITAYKTSKIDKYEH